MDIVCELKVCKMQNSVKGCKPRLNLLNLPFHKKYRSPFEIVASMLEVMKDQEMGRFSLMKHTTINTVQVRNYLESLVQMGFVRTEKRYSQILYRTTERGIEFLRQYHVLQGMLLDTSIRNGPNRIVENTCESPNRQQYYVTRLVKT
jgi:predicted transcriptional regulator